MTHTRSRNRTSRAFVPVAWALVLLLSTAALAACQSSDDSGPTVADAGGDTGGLRVVAPTAASELIAGPTKPTVIDVRTPEEYDQGHLDGALLIDFYGDDFVAAIDDLDRDQPYVIYCRSGSRSGQAREIMSDLGFADVADIEGGITAWEADGLPTVR